MLLNSRHVELDSMYTPESTWSVGWPSEHQVTPGERTPVPFPAPPDPPPPRPARSWLPSASPAAAQPRPLSTRASTQCSWMRLLPRICSNLLAFPTKYVRVAYSHNMQITSNSLGLPLRRLPLAVTSAHFLATWLVAELTELLLHMNLLAYLRLPQR